MVYSYFIVSTRPGSIQVFMYPGQVCNLRAGTWIMGAVRIHLKIELSF